MYVIYTFAKKNHRGKRWFFVWLRRGLVRLAQEISFFGAIPGICCEITTPNTLNTICSQQLLIKAFRYKKTTVVSGGFFVSEGLTK